MRFKHQEPFVLQFERAESVGDCIHILCKSIEADAEVQASLADKSTEQLRLMLKNACIACPEQKLQSFGRTQLVSLLTSLISDEIQGNANLIVELLDLDAPMTEQAAPPPNRLRNYFKGPPDAN